MYPRSLGGKYGFEVGLKERYSFDGELPNDYVIQLPHHTDAWVIAEDANKAEAIRSMETFIAEAQAALEELRRQ